MMNAKQSTRDSKYYCTICNKTFSTKSNFLRHMRSPIHVENVQYLDTKVMPSEVHRVRTPSFCDTKNVQINMSSDNSALNSSTTGMLGLGEKEADECVEQTVHAPSFERGQQIKQESATVKKVEDHQDVFNRVNDSTLERISSSYNFNHEQTVDNARGKNKITIVIDHGYTHQLDETRADEYNKCIRNDTGGVGQKQECEVNSSTSDQVSYQVENSTEYSLESLYDQIIANGNDLSTRYGSQECSILGLQTAVAGMTSPHRETTANSIFIMQLTSQEGSKDLGTSTVKQPVEMDCSAESNKNVNHLETSGGIEAHSSNVEYNLTINNRTQSKSELRQEDNEKISHQILAADVNNSNNVQLSDTLGLPVLNVDDPALGFMTVYENHNCLESAPIDISQQCMDVLFETDTQQMRDKQVQNASGKAKGVTALSDNKWSKDLRKRRAVSLNEADEGTFFCCGYYYSQIGSLYKHFRSKKHKISSGEMDSDKRRNSLNAALESLRHQASENILKEQKMSEGIAADGTFFCCGHYFARKGSLYEHFQSKKHKISSGEMDSDKNPFKLPYTCCNKVYKRRNSLNAHLKSLRHQAREKMSKKQKMSEGIAAKQDAMSDSLSESRKSIVNKDSNDLGAGSTFSPNVDAIKEDADMDVSTGDSLLIDNLDTKKKFKKKVFSKMYCNVCQKVIVSKSAKYHELSDLHMMAVLACTELPDEIFTKCADKVSNTGQTASENITHLTKTEYVLPEVSKMEDSYIPNKAHAMPEKKCSEKAALSSKKAALSTTKAKHTRYCSVCNVEVIRRSLTRHFTTLKHRIALLQNTVKTEKDDMVKDKNNEQKRNEQTDEGYTVAMDCGDSHCLDDHDVVDGPNMDFAEAFLCSVCGAFSNTKTCENSHDLFLYSAAATDSEVVTDLEANNSDIAPDMVPNYSKVVTDMASIADYEGDEKASIADNEGDDMANIADNDGYDTASITANDSSMMIFEIVTANAAAVCLDNHLPKGKDQVCKLCEQTFKTMDLLHKHVLGHVGQLPFKCKLYMTNKAHL
ncbi:uncharacterized protein LOC127879599 isoform X2 [Dreissena polymorpha]|uniref:uncharacterized protein LOC127879599 isoform X2 n=1 Tax=Dreissena polymorpha TaxID=45954 RepID=UPI0022654A68|nr:uncharacterized protein LOC127879599 isoform X2 [Dreissena polymorpha]